MRLTNTQEGYITIDTPTGYHETKRGGETMEEHNCCRCSQRKKERSPEEYKRLIHRLNRIEGQIRGIRGMVEAGAARIRSSTSW